MTRGCETTARREWVLTVWIDPEDRVVRHRYRRLWVFRPTGAAEHVRVGWRWTRRELVAGVLELGGVKNLEQSSQ